MAKHLEFVLCVNAVLAHLPDITHREIRGPSESLNPNPLESVSKDLEALGITVKSSSGQLFSSVAGSARHGGGILRVTMAWLVLWFRCIQWAKTRHTVPADPSWRYTKIPVRLFKSPHILL